MKKGLTLLATSALIFSVGQSAWLCAQPAELSGGLPTESRLFYESYAHSSYVDKTWVVGYAPKVTCLFLNPREAPISPAAPIVWQHYYQGTMEGYCKTIVGTRPTGIPAGSHALAYHYGWLGITSRLSQGYPQGERVVESVLVPQQPFTRQGGVLILGSPTTLKFAEECSPSHRGPSGKTLEK